MNDLKLTRRVFGISALSAAILSQTGLSFASTAGFKNPLLLMQPEEILKRSQIKDGHQSKKVNAQDAPTSFGWQQVVSINFDFTKIRWV